MLDNNTHKRLSNVKDRVNKCWKLLKRLQDCFDLMKISGDYQKEWFVKKF